MLTGYNTDIRRGDVVVHVQTEDKGTDNPCVESLIYVGGRVVASKVSSYEELLENGGEESEIARFMDRQHRTIVAAVRRGRLDEKLQLATGDNGVGDDDGADDETPSGIHAVVSEIEIALPEPTDDSPTPPKPVAEAPREPLRLDLSSATPLAMGETVVVWVRATRGDAMAGDVDVRVEMISTVQAPVVLAEGRTDSEGLFKTDLEVPDLDDGSAAVIVSGADSGGFAEVKELI